MIALHWLAGALILELVVHGWIMVHGSPSAATAFGLYQSHKSIGFLVVALTGARLAARFGGKSPPEPASAPWERVLAAWVQAAFYALTLGAVASGWLVVSASPLPIPTRFFDLFVIPNVAPPNAALFAAAALAHKLAAWSIVGLVAMHVAGALKHHFVDRDDVLTRMLPRGRGAFFLPRASTTGSTRASPGSISVSGGRPEGLGGGRDEAGGGVTRNSG